MKKQREREVEKRSVRSRQTVQTSRESAENNTSFLVKFSGRVFFAMSSEFTFGDNTDEFTIFIFFLNLADRGLHRVSDHSDTDVVLTACTSGADKVNQTVHTQKTR